MIPILLLVTVAGGTAYWAGLVPSRVQHASHEATGSASYQCSMHPQIVSAKPGICPICQMRLTKVEEAARPGREGMVAGNAPDQGERKPKFYRHPMRSDVVSPVPAKDEMGMDYVPVYDDAPSGNESTVPGHAPFTLSMERQQLIGVTRGRVERRPLEVEIRAVGRIAYDPALYRAIVEYREASRARGSLDRGIAEARAGGDALVRGAYLRLRQQGLSDDAIRQLTRSARDPVELLLPGDQVWVYAQVYEYEMPLVEPGQVMRVEAPSHPGRMFMAKVVAVDPILDPATRTVRVRGLVSTPERSLRPESFVSVTIGVPLGEKLAVPREAILDTGKHQIAFVVKDGGHFEPRAVTLGRDAEGYYEVLSGLESGEEVVTSANFLIDSESRFRAAVAAFKSAPSGHQH